ncbi:MAG: gliding motility-associated C-terminal domain-containing protein, partial [Saprospiraceae bacterium]
LPVITCSSTESSVSFAWQEIAGATGYMVNGVFQNETSYDVTGLQPNEAITVMVEAVSGNACGNSFEQSGCTAQDCPTIVLQLEEVAPLCQYGSSISLQANEQGGQWSGPGITDSSSGIFNPAFANEGVNTVEYILSNGSCSYSESIEIEVESALDLPVITCSSTESSVSFAWQEIAGATGYMVNGVFQNETSYDVIGLQPNEATTVMVEAVNGNACGNSFEQSGCAAESCPTIVLQIEEVAPLCETIGNISLLASESGGEWSGSGITDSDSGTFNPSLANTGMNTIVYTLSNGSCEYSESIEIEVYEALSTPEVICNSTVSEVNFSWEEVEGATGYLVNGVLQNETSYVANNLQPNQEVNVTVEAVSGNACANSIATSDCLTEDCANVSLLINDVPSICGNEIPNDFIQLEVDIEGTSLQGTWSGAGVVDPVNGLFDPSQGFGLYDIAYTITDNACEFSESITIQIQEPLEIEITQLGVLDCSSNLPILVCDAQADLIYSWTTSTGEILSDSQIEATEEGTYNLLVTNPISGCTATSDITVLDESEAPQISLSTLDNLITCTNVEVLLDAIGSQAGVNTTYQWFGPSGELPVGNIPTQQLVTESGDYTLVVADLANSCTSTASLTVVENTELPTVDAGEPQMIGCNEEEKTLTGFASADANLLNWIDANGEVLPSTLLLDNNTSTTIDEPGIYTLQAINTATGCTSEDQVLVTVNENVPSAILAEIEQPSCEGEQDAVIEIASVQGGTAPYEYSLNEGSFTETMLYPYLTPGNYMLEVKDADGCTYEEEVLIAETEEVMVAIGMDEVLTLGESQMIHLYTNLEETDIDTVIWSCEELLECMDDDCMLVKVSPQNSTEVYATIIKKAGCVGEASIRLTVEKPRDVYIPNAFSPNGDDVNDVFYLQGKKEVVSVNRLQIFNRWGALIFNATDFDLNDSTKGWDGTLNGKPMNPDVFVYQAEVEFIDGEVLLLSGDVTLMR